MVIYFWYDKGVFIYINELALAVATLGALAVRNARRSWYRYAHSLPLHFPFFVISVDPQYGYCTVDYLNLSLYYVTPHIRVSVSYLSINFELFVLFFFIRKQVI